MLKLNETSFSMTKASFQMAVWGLIILLGGALSQWGGLSADFLLVLWGVVTLLGLLAQAAALVRGMTLNLGIWTALMVAGWLFTFYVTKFDNGAHADLYGDLAGVWLILLALGYIATAFQVDKRFLIIAALHLLAGALIELSARRVISLDFVDTYSSLLLGLVGGLPLLVAALPAWYREEQPQPQLQRQAAPPPQGVKPY